MEINSFKRNDDSSGVRHFRNGFTMLALVITMVFMTCMSITTTAQQNKSFTIEFKNKSLVDIFNWFEENSEYTFTYNSGVLKSDATRVNATFDKADISTILRACLRGTRFTYEMLDKHIVIKNVEQTTYTISGRVLDEKNQSLPGVTIRIDGTSLGFVTDSRGEFKAPITQQNLVLVFSYIGYKTQKIAVKAGDKLVVKMEEDISDLGVVQVIAYGERNKREVIGSISGIKGEDIKEIPSSSLENLLQGRMSGVEVTNMSGAPGGGGTIVSVRGYNSLVDQNTLRMNDYGEPLYVIDGIPVQGFSSPITGTNALSSIDPSTIESIEVLKDAASAAIYGSRAGRGVILITTKKGREGKAKFSANVSYSLAYLPQTPTQTGGKDVRKYALEALRNMQRPYLDPATNTYKYPTGLLDAYGTTNYGGVYDWFWNKALSGIPSSGENPVNPLVQDSLNPFYNNSTDWFDYAFRTGKVLNANIQASGGSEKTQYMVGAGFYNEKGIAYGSDFKRLNFLTNLNIRPITNLVVDSRFSISYMGRNRGASDGVRSADKIERMPVDPKKTSSFLPGGGYIEEEMLRTINEQREKNEELDLKASLVLKYNIFKDLQLSVNGSATYNIASVNLFLPTILNSDGLNTSSFQIERRMTLLNEDMLSYRKQFNDVHTIDLLAGFSLQKNTTNFNYGEGHGGASDKVHYIYDGFPELPSTGIATEYKILQHAQSSLEETAMVSWFARAAYNYKQRYLVEFTFRQDGSSVFGDKNKYANFPAVALGWAFSEEKFMDWAWWLSYAKFRASYGKSGEIFPDPYRAHGLLVPGGEFLGRPVMSIDDDWLHKGGMINRELKWVKHDQYDFGLDLDFLDYKLKLKLDYYYRWSTGVIGNAKLPSTLYLYENQPMNAHDVSNEGLELELIADILKTSTFSWRMRFNASRNWNRLKKTYNGKDIGLPNGIPDHMLGRPLYGLYTYKVGKIFENVNEIPLYYGTDGSANLMYLADKRYPYGVGMKVIEDINGDGQSSYTDKVYMGQTIPKVYGGWANEIYWKNFDVNVLFSYSIGRKMINAYGKSSLNPIDVAQGKNLYMDISDLKFWQKPGDAASSDMYPMLSSFDNTMMQFYSLTSDNVENVSYVKMKQLTIGYNFPKDWIQKIKLTNVRLFFTGENLFTITNYSGTDPEVVSIFSGIDNFSAYPLARRLTFGLTLNF